MILIASEKREFVHVIGVAAVVSPVISCRHTTNYGCIQRIPPSGSHIKGTWETDYSLVENYQEKIPWNDLWQFQGTDPVSGRCADNVAAGGDDDAGHVKTRLQHYKTAWKLSQRMFQT